MPIIGRRPTVIASPQSRRKITKKLVSKLKHLQACDVPLPNPTILEVKFYIRHDLHYSKIHVKGDDLPLQTPISIVFDSLDRIPCFIASQLEAQRLTDTNRQSVQLSAILVFLHEYLATDTTKTSSNPTVFVWHDTKRRRTFCLFAHITRKMEPRHYTVAELLSFRPSRASETAHDLLTKLKSDPEIGKH